MSYQVLARKWRPKYFKDVLGQEHITRTLINSILKDKVAHAYLLTGTRGIGKTTIARIFAKAIRCTSLSSDGEPCHKCDSCVGVSTGNSLDYIEVDGASNNSVDDIRDLIENVQYLPTTGRYKVYVIDEVHMLSVNAFNALLKTLEEPPEHVVFIFATTDPQKLLGTILSRCQRYDFKNAKIEDLENQIKKIAEVEGISFENESQVKELARQGKGSFRDTLSLLDQILSLTIGKEVTEKTMVLSLGLANTSSVNNILKGIILKDRMIIKESFESIISENVDLKKFCLQFLDKLYRIIDEVSSTGTSDLLESREAGLIELMWVYESLMRDFEWALSSLDAERSIEFVLIKTALRDEILGHQNIDPLKKKTNLENNKAKIAESNTETGNPTSSTEDIVVNDKKSWGGFIQSLYDNNNSATAINLERGNLINESSFGVEGATYKIAFDINCKIFYDYLSEQEHKKVLVSHLADYLQESKDAFSIELSILNEEQVLESNFKSRADVVIQSEKDVKEEKTNHILNNKFIVEAEKIFNSKIDKVVLNDK